MFAVTTDSKNFYEHNQFDHRPHPTPAAQPACAPGGYVFLPRILDKGRASVAGKLGEYRYGAKSMDRHFFNFVGLDPRSFGQGTCERRRRPGTADVDSSQCKNQRQPWEIAAWSEYHLRRSPDSDHETLTDFAEEVKKFNPNREDINTWFDLLDLDDYCSFGGKA
ncbi:MAG: DUF5069 domain-containing protein [Limisphaerales bacterium]